MQRIVINGDFLAMQTFAGVSRFADETLKELDDMLDKMDVVLLTPEYAERKVSYKNIKVVKMGRKSLNIWRNTTLPRYIKKHKGLLVDFTQAFPIGIKGIIYIHDCIPELYPSGYETKLKRFVRRPIKLLQRKLAARNARVLMTLTENSKKDIIHFFKVKEEKIVVTYTGWQHISNTVEDMTVFENFPDIKEENYCFTLGSRVWHKNLKWVLAAAKENPQYKFVISGDNRFLANFEKVKKSVSSNVIFTGYISDGQIRSLMAHCKAFLFPTLYEGFGMPPMEALSAGAPIIISDTSCMPEIYQDAAHYINPLVYSGINIDEILAGKVAEPETVLNQYSWKRTASILYREIIKCVKA